MKERREGMRRPLPSPWTVPRRWDLCGPTWAGQGRGGRATCRTWIGRRARVEQIFYWNCPFYQCCAYWIVNCDYCAKRLETVNLWSIEVGCQSSKLVNVVLVEKFQNIPPPTKKVNRNCDRESRNCIFCQNAIAQSINQARQWLVNTAFIYLRRSPYWFGLVLVFCSCPLSCTIFKWWFG